MVELGEGARADGIGPLHLEDVRLLRTEHFLELGFEHARLMDVASDQGRKAPGS